MLATTSYTDYSLHAFLPTIPSPLSPRSANIYGRRSADFTSMEKQKQSAQPSETHSTAQATPFAKRLVKKAPSPKQDELKERRRGMFLKKVREGREDRRFEARGEDIMRLDFMQRQRAWEAERAREAPHLPSDPLEDEEVEDGYSYELPTLSGSAMQTSSAPQASQQPVFSWPEEVDEVAQREDEELEALLSYMPDDRSEEPMGSEPRSDHLWSDDDDYNALFSELMDFDGGQQNQTQPQPQPQLQSETSQLVPSAQGGEDMDLS